MHIPALIEQDLFSPAKVAEGLRTSTSEVAHTLGLSRDAVSRRDRISSRKVQVRLREMVEILNRVEHAQGSVLAAYAWYRSEPLVGFGGMTAEELVRNGKADYVRAHLDRINSGGFA